MKRKIISTLLVLTMVVSGGAMAFASEPAESVKAKNSNAIMSPDAISVRLVSWVGNKLKINVQGYVGGMVVYNGHTGYRVGDMFTTKTGEVTIPLTSSDLDYVRLYIGDDIYSFRR